MEIFQSLQSENPKTSVYYSLQTGGITTEGATIFKQKVYGPVIIITVVCYFLMGLGSLIILIVILLLAYTTFRSVSVQHYKFYK